MAGDGGSIRTARNRLPVLGHILPLRRRPVDFLVGLRAEGDLVRVYFGPMPVLVVNSPRLIQQVLVTQRDKFEKGALFDKVRLVLGDSLVTSNGASHRSHRRLVQPVFRAERIAHYGEHMADLASARAESWRAKEVVQVDREMHELTLSVVSRTLFASTIGQRATAEIHRWLPVIVNGIIRRTILSTLLVEHLPTPANRRFDTARIRLANVVDEVIHGYQSDPTDHGDFLSMLIRTHEAGNEITAEQLRDELITMMLSATETTAVALAWTFHELARHPEIQERVHREIADSTPPDAQPSTDVSRLTYMGRAVTEALRLHTPPLIIMRRSIARVELDGSYLPPGTEFAISPAALHRDADLFPNPLRFDPDRWLPERSSALPRGAFIPFGAGHRKCIGSAYALLEMKIVVAEIVSRYRLRPVPDSPVKEVAGTVIHPSSLPMIADPRDTRAHPGVSSAEALEQDCMTASADSAPEGLPEAHRAGRQVAIQRHDQPAGIVATPSAATTAT